jgi:hypothetical protein
MDASDRIRRNQQATIAAAASVKQSFLATWTSASTTLTYELYKNGSAPVVGAYVNAIGLASTARIVSFTPSSQTTGTLVISTATTTAQATQTKVIMAPSGPSITKYASYESKYNNQAGISYLSYDTGVPRFASKMGAFGCEGKN